MDPAFWNSQVTHDGFLLEHKTQSVSTTYVVFMHDWHTFKAVQVVHIDLQPAHFAEAFT